METLASLLEATRLGDLVNAWDWVWPICEILHFAGMAVLIGTIGVVDLRILGFGKGIPLAAAERLVPIGIGAFVVNAVTGFVFVAGNPIGGPMEYFMNTAFQIKMLLILLAGINVFAFYFAGVARAAESVGAVGDAPRAAKIIAAASIFFWAGVIYFGRMIMYNDTLLYALGL